ncbi:hypothetical protein M9H77_12018 [Catharanthus roseus]|uniref:Uncharacterized protein n=1 Tax=Catharanthus roseus TaxID=4058 RepID=A0ACC0BG87_CATRO|nr:hypothetical protein M9H77_12018 [Catharanthus roseus]
MMISSCTPGLLFLLLGGHMFSNFTGSLVHMRYLSLLEDFEAINTYSWGSCVLDFLYRHLCTAALGGARQIEGALVILQIWAWSHIPLLQPQLIRHELDDPLAPLGVIWCTSFDCTQLPTHTLVTYRDQLDFMPSDQFVWLPYHGRDLVPSDLWGAEVPFICYEIVEYHFPRCVNRQFARDQHIPASCDSQLDLYRIILEEMITLIEGRSMLAI